MNRPLDEMVRAHVGARRLDDEQFEALQPAAPRRARGPWLAVAALLLLGLALALWPPRAPVDLHAAIAREVARNHRRAKPLEVEGADLAELRAHFARLDFALVDSTAQRAGGLGLLGGRHCSVLGHEAAQLRYRHPETGETHTVYQAAATPFRDQLGAGPEAPHIELVDGLRVSMWLEAGLLVVRTDPP